MPLSPDDIAVRRGRISATQVAQIAGLSKWGGPVSAWLDILGRTVDDGDPSPDLLRGTHLEPGMLSWYAELTGYALQPGRTVVYPDDDRYCATPDAWATPDGDSGPHLVEVKCPRRGDDWGDEGTDEIPLYYVPQVTWQLGVCGLAWCDVIALIWGELRTYHIAFDPALFASLRRIASNFHDHYVATDTEPPPDASHAYAEYLARLYPSALTKELLPPTVEIEARAQDYLAAKAAEKQAQADIALAKACMKKYIGSAAGIQSDGWRARWPTITRKPTVDWQAYARALGGTDDGAQAYKQQVKPYRQFRLTETKK